MSHYTTLVNLMACLILVPPYAMSVYNKQGEVKDSVIGPLEEGIGLTLSCEVRGANLPFSTWRSLNRLRSGVTRCRYNLKRWGYVDDDLCDCGAAQTNAHLITCGQLQQTCTQNDLLAANDRALYVAEYWKFKA
ncbi:hypothetical protein M8J77_023072 [Diaphorina citri]|nr:hypothetical protein M8J77_023072 [Diaphorina citri]